MSLRRDGFGRITPVLLLLFLSGIFAQAARAAAPAIMPGFPLRAGANVMLMWLPVPGATSYVVYRGEKSGGPYQKVSESPATNFMDQNVPQDKSFYYVVKPVVGGKEEESSREVAMIGLEPLPKPKITAHLLTDDNKVALRWDPVAKAAFFNVFRSEKEKGDYKLLNSVQDTRFTDSAVAVGKEYYYKLVAVSTANIESPLSDPYVVRVEKKKVAGPGGIQKVRKPVKYIDAFDVDADFALRGPRDIALDGEGGVFVVDASGYAVHVNKDLKVVRIVGKAPNDFKGFWGFASGVFFDRKSKELYISYTDAGALRVFSPVGELVKTYILPKPDPKTVSTTDFESRPADCALGLDGTLWVTDAGYMQLVAVDKNATEPGAKVIKRIGLNRNHPDRKKPDVHALYGPSSVAVHPKSGNIYVMETPGQRLSVFDKDGKFLRTLGARGEAPGAFLQPTGLAIDEQGVIFVGDRNLERIQLFDDAGAYVATLVDPREKDANKEERVAPATSGIAVEGQRVFVADLTKEQVRVYEIPK